jgi:hypothetical protein
MRGHATREKHDTWEQLVLVLLLLVVSTARSVFNVLTDGGSTWPQHATTAA